jgi:hypothetical protein
VAAEDPAKMMLSKLLAVPALRDRYLGYVREIADKWLDWEVLGPIAESYQAVIADVVRSDTRKLAGNEAFEASRAAIKSFADSRRAFLLSHPAIQALGE